MKRLVPALVIIMIAATVACSGVPAAVSTAEPPASEPTATPTASPSSSAALPEPRAKTVYALYGEPLGDHARLRINRLTIGSGATHDIGSIEMAQPLVASPDGARLLTVHHIRTAEERSDEVVVLQGRRLQRATTIFSVRRGSVSGETWSRDGGHIFFIHGVPDHPDEPSPTSYVVYRARVSGGGLERIASFRRPWTVGFGPGVEDAAGDLWFIEEGEGGFAGMTRIDVDRGRAHHRDHPLRGETVGHAALAPDGRTLFYAAGPNVHAFDLATSRDRVVYRLQPKRHVHRIVPMPDATSVLVLDVSADGIGAKTRLVSVADGTARTLHKDLDPSYLGPSSVSADGSTIWFETWCFCGGADERFALYDVASGRLQALGLPANAGIRSLGFLIV